MAYQKDARAKTKVERAAKDDYGRSRKKEERPRLEKRKPISGEFSLPKRSVLDHWNSWFTKRYVIQSPLRPWEVEEELLKVTDLNRSAPFGSLDYTEPKYFIGQVGNDTFHIGQQRTGDFSTPILRGSYTASENGTIIYLVSEYPSIARYATGFVIALYLFIILLIPKNFDWPAKALGIALLMGLVIYFIRLGYASVRKENLERFRGAVKGGAAS